MKIFERMAQEGHEQLIFCYDKSTGLRAIIAIHDTTLGPATGGCRMYIYDTEEEAIEDVLRLSKAMTFKIAAAGLNLGGGKCIIWGDPPTEKCEALFRSLGRFINTLGGRFITGTDLGTVNEDFVWARQETPYVCALPEEYGGSGDTAVITAYGVWHGLKAAANWCWGSESLQGKRVAIQGVGKVGCHLINYLQHDGAECIISDTEPKRIEVVKGSYKDMMVVEPERIYDIDCHIFSPNAIGGILNDRTIPRLKCQVIGGAANNQLAEPIHGDMLRERGILYCPDFVINSGGLIQVADEQQGFNRERAFRKAANIYLRLMEIFRISKERNISTYNTAIQLAQERIQAIQGLKHIYAAH
ncbi:MAG: Glu/Leu/Phe/Val dehydrogenase dimerization domain-containing protein [Thermodesulfobacteriota bacterium]